jgi:hypothetical protein
MSFLIQDYLSDMDMLQMDVFNLFIELEMSQKGRLTQMKRGKWLLFFLV